MSEMTPREIVQELDRYIVGQSDAKRWVALALRSRWRRRQVKQDAMRQEITPKNILMMGPTGIGKTEIARRLARLAGAPFIKVEATRFTEIGYVGREVDSIIKDLVEIAVTMVKEQQAAFLRGQAEDEAEDKIIQQLQKTRATTNDTLLHNASIQEIRKRLREGYFDDWEIEVETSDAAVGLEIVGPPGMEEMMSQLQKMMSQVQQQNRHKQKTMKVKEARKRLMEEGVEKLMDQDVIRQKALESVEEDGIVFIDEIDKIVSSSENLRGAEVSREGVQRDLLPLIEGSTVSTRYGMIRTDHILFIASGAFQLSKPSDLIPELQGRLPIRVELKPLDAEQFKRILVEPDASLVQQYAALLATENVTLEFADSGVQRIAEIAMHANEVAENIGARRLHAVMERLLAEVSFSAADQSGTKVVVDDAFVDQSLSDILESHEQIRYIL